MALMVKNPTANAGDVTHGFSPWSERLSGGGHENLLHYSYLQNSMDRGT